MKKQQKRLYIGFFILILWGIFFVFEKKEFFSSREAFATSEKEINYANIPACDLEQESKNYLEEIYTFSPNHFEVSKPKLIFNNTDIIYVGDKIAVGKEDGKNITIYKKGLNELYGENCSKAHLERLQSTVAHEYAHHIDFNSGIIKNNLKTADLEYSAQLGGENALFELVWNKKNPKTPNINQEEESKVKELKNILASL